MKDGWADGKSKAGRMGDRRPPALEDEMIRQAMDGFAKELSQQTQLGARSAEAVCVLCRFDHVVSDPSIITAPWRGQTKARAGTVNEKTAGHAAGV